MKKIGIPILLNNGKINKINNINKIQLSANNNLTIIKILIPQTINKEVKMINNKLEFLSKITINMLTISIMSNTKTKWIVQLMNNTSNKLNLTTILLVHMELTCNKMQTLKLLVITIRNMLISIKILTIKQ